MSDFRPSRLRRLQHAWHRFWARLSMRLEPSPPWHKPRRSLWRLRYGFSWLRVPQWLRRCLHALQRGLRRAESSLARTGQQVSENVARSAVGEGAVQLARQGQRLESRLIAGMIATAKRFGALLTWLVPAPLRRWFHWAGCQVWFSASVLVAFLGRWFRTRHYWHLLGGLPAFLLTLPLAYCMVRLPFYAADSKSQRYRRAADIAMQNQDYATAGLFYRKLYQLGANSEAIEYRVALNELASGKEDEAVARLRQLAPEQRSGFAPAHIWMARWYLEGKSGLNSEKAEAAAEQHLTFALDRDPSNVEARTLRALSRQRASRWQEAELDLRQVVQQLPEEGVTLARLYARQGRWEAARREVEKVQRIFQDKVAQRVELDVYEYVTWSHAHRIMGDLDEAEAVLIAGHEKHPAADELTDRLYDQLIQIAASRFARREGDAQQVLERFLHAAQLKPDKTDPLVMLSDCMADRSQFGEYVRQAIGELLDRGEAPARLYAIAAPLFGMQGDMPRAVRYLRKAVELDPRDSYSLNNLAFALFTLDAQHDDQALDLVNRALRIEPDQALYRETRGQLLVRLGRYQEAIADLNFALNGLGDQPSIHAALATAYDQLGQPEAARVHRQQAR